MRTGNTEHIDLGGLIAWFSEAQPGGALVYALGDLGRDRCHGYRNSATTVLDAVGKKVWEWQRKELAELYQRRMRDGFAYVVVRRRDVDRRDVANERGQLAQRLGKIADVV